MERHGDLSPSCRSVARTRESLGRVAQPFIRMFLDTSPITRPGIHEGHVVRRTDGGKYLRRIQHNVAPNQSPSTG